MAVLFLIFWGLSILFSIVSTRIYIPTNRAQVFPFLLTLTNTCYFLFDNNRFDMWDDTSHIFFYLLLPHDLWFWDLFMHLLTICVSSLGKCLYRSSVYFLIKLLGFVFFFLMLSFMSTLHISYINPYWMYHLQTSSPILLIVSLPVQKLFSLI